MPFDEPKQPDWPINVMVFHPGDEAHIEDIKTAIKPTEDPIKEFELNGETKTTHTTEHHFSTKRYALLFAPGEYKNCSFEVGYYVQMAGLGKTATGEDAVRFTADEGEASGPYVPALNKDLPCEEGGTINYPGSGLCLDTFWRMAENFSSESTMWAVSQAAPLRRVHVRKNLDLGDAYAFGSGGFLANAQVDGKCNYFNQQQLFSRAVHFNGDAGSVSGGVWNTVFSGCTGVVPAEGKVPGTDNLVVTVEETPKVCLEKPYIVMTKSGDYELHIPKFTTDDTSGAQLDGSNTEVRCFSRVKVGKAILPLDEDGNYAEIDDDKYNELTESDGKLTLELQEALDEGKDLVLSPGIYFLTQPLVVKKPNQVILGIGLATLVAPQDGSPCIRVQAGTPGVKIASVVLEGSVQKKAFSSHANADKVRSLIDFGEADKTGFDDPGDASNPGLLSDIFTRVGGSNPDRSVMTDAMVRIFSGNVIGDNLWLWRADHVKLRPGEKPNDEKLKLYHQVGWERNEDGKIILHEECIAKNALVVEGNDVSIYGLFAEHTKEDQMIWKGENGSVSFFQCELPYDVDEFTHTGYHIHKDVESHTARGIGVYCNFTCFDVTASKGISMPSKDDVTVENPYTLFLANKGGIDHVVYKGEEKYGKAVNEKNQTGRGWIGTDPETSTMVKLFRIFINLLPY